MATEHKFCLGGLLPTITLLKINRSDNKIPIITVQSNLLNLHKEGIDQKSTKEIFEMILQR